MKRLLIISAILFWVSTAVSQEDFNKSYISLEVDPAPFILGGYSFSLKYSPEELSKTAFMVSIYSSDFPNSMMNKVNKERMWTNLRLETSYAIFADFFLENDKRGFYFGPSIFLYNKSVELSSVNERTKFFTLYPNIRAGYVWYPFKNLNLYLNPWLNFGTEINLDNKNELNGTTFIPNKFYYIAAVHMGYSLSW